MVVEDYEAVKSSATGRNSSKNNIEKSNNRRGDSYDLTDLDNKDVSVAAASRPRTQHGADESPVNQSPKADSNDEPPAQAALGVA